MEQETEIKEEVLTADQENEVIKNELAIIPDADRKEIATVAKQEDLLLIASTKKKISTFKRRFPAKNFVITEDLKYDKATLDKATEQWREVKNWRTKEAEVAIKKLKDPYVKLTKFYNDTFNPLIADVKAIEKPISDYVDKLEALKKEEDEREEREKEQRTQNRVKELIDAGMSFDGSFYSIGSEEFGVETISLGMSDINSLTDDLYSKILLDIQSKAAIIKDKQDAKDADILQKQKDKEAADLLEKENLKKEQDKLEEDKKKLKEANTRTRARELKSLGFIADDGAKVYYSTPVTITFKQVEDLDIDQWEALITESEARIETAKDQEEKQKLVTARETQLLSLGLNKYPVNFELVYKQNVASVSHTAISKLNATEWEEKISVIKEIIEKQKEEFESDTKIANEKKELAKERETILAPYWQFVTDDEKKTLGDFDERAFGFLLAAKKKQHEDDLEDKRKKKLQADNDALAKLDDIGKYKNYVAQLKSIQVPEVTTKEVKDMLDKISGLISKL